MPTRADTTELREVILKTRGFDRALPNHLRRRLRAAASPAADAAKAAALATPSSGTGTTGLRAAIAASIRIEIPAGVRRAGVFIKADASRMPAGQKTLAKRLEGIGRWRHPLFGNREAWFNQRSHPYFRRTVAARLTTARFDMYDAIDDALRQAGLDS